MIRIGAIAPGSPRDPNLPEKPGISLMLVLIPAAAAAAMILAPPPARAAAPAATVSPGLTAGEGEAVTGACPTFSWTPGTAGAHELVVYELDGAGGEPGVVLSLDLPAGASSWSPGRQDCLEPGRRYAWTVRARGGEGAPAGGWAEPALFRVASAPSEDEVARAIEVLRRHLERGGDAEASAEDPIPRDQRTLLAQRPAQEEAGARGGSRVPAAAPPEEAAALRPAAAPSLGSPSLTLSGNLALGSAANVFKDGEPFLWNDSSSNTALGRQALASATGTATGNTAVGAFALKDATGARASEGKNNTAVGVTALRSSTTGNENTAIGSAVLRYNTTGYNNTGVGAVALFNNTSGWGNVAIGVGALLNSTDGYDNVAIGPRAGQNASGPGHNDNIFISNFGESGDSGKIRIGKQGTQDATFIAGISGATTGQAGGDVVLVDSDGQLGTTSCGTYVAVATCPIGNVDGPNCDRVPAGSFCESEGECGTSDDLNNCAGFDWYLRTD